MTRDVAAGPVGWAGGGAGVAWVVGLVWHGSDRHVGLSRSGLEVDAASRGRDGSAWDGLSDRAGQGGREQGGPVGVGRYDPEGAGLSGGNGAGRRGWSVRVGTTRVGKSGWTGRSVRDG